MYTMSHKIFIDFIKLTRFCVQFRQPLVNPDDSLENCHIQILITITMAGF